MRWLVSLVALLNATACTTENADFDPRSSGSDSGASGSGSGSTTGTSPGTGVADGTGGGSTGSSEIACEADLYAINELGELYLIDADTGEVRLELTEALAHSWAIATRPTDGALYLSPVNVPSVLRRLDPLTLELNDDLPLVGDDIDQMARAGFDGSGTLWLGTDDLGLFFPYDPGPESLGMPELFPSGSGGDLAFFEPGLALGVASDGSAYLLDVSTSFMASPTTVSDLPAGVSGLALDSDDRLWAATTNGQLLRIDVTGSTTDPFFAVDTDETVDLGIAIIDDLAPVLVHPTDC